MFKNALESIYVQILASMYNFIHYLQERNGLEYSNMHEIPSVYREKAENKGEFFNELHKSESWYYAKFQDYALTTSSPELGERHRQTHAERKVDENN